MYKDAIGVDMLCGEGVDRVLNMEEPLPDDFGLFAHIDCMSVLEHSKKPWTLAANIEKSLITGGTLLITVPFVWRVHAYPSDYWRFTVEGVRELFPCIKWKSLVYAHSFCDKDAGRIPTHLENTRVFFERTEVYGFGQKE
jgi:hypothetical protein